MPDSQPLFSFYDKIGKTFDIDNASLVRVNCAEHLLRLSNLRGHCKSSSTLQCGGSATQVSIPLTNATLDLEDLNEFDDFCTN